MSAPIPAPPQEDTLIPHASLLRTTLASFSSPSPTTSDAALKTFCKTLDHYLQLPAILDPILPSLLPPLLSLSKKALPSLPTATIYSLRRPLLVPFTALYTLAKVRGPKPFSRHFPHTISDLHFLLHHLPLLESHPNRDLLWHIRYILYLWLSVAIRLPFPLHTLIPPEQIQNLIHLTKKVLFVSGPVSTAASTFLARLLSRRDAAEYRHEIVTWATQHPLELSAERPTRVVALGLLAALFKLGHRDDINQYANLILQRLMPMVQGDTICETTGEAHLLVKLAVRVALAVLPPRLASWRYQRGQRIVFEKAGDHLRRREDGGVAGHVGDLEHADERETTEQAMEVVEQVAEIVLVGLGHEDTVVRWSAAKGVGRVTSRLARDFAVDVIEGVLALFETMGEVRSDAAWHGGCLALAELARRGLLLPGEGEFGKALTVVGRASSFDMRRGANSVGAHVRDAACYAVWAIARAYSKQDVAPYASIIMNHMLPVALLDREVNCRRAAAAAVQECVGRLSEELFDDGIRLVTMADYFSLGDRVAAYLRIAPQVAMLASGVHFDCILLELSTRKLFHWDPVIRSLAAKSLAAMVEVDKDGVISAQIVPELVQCSTNRGNMTTRHGAVLGLAETAKVVGLPGLGSLAEQIRDLPCVLKESKLFVGRSGDEMRLACCHLIECLAIGAGDLYIQSDLCRNAALKALEFLESIFGAGKEAMYAKATQAYSALCDHVISRDSCWHENVTQRILDGLTKQGISLFQRGFALAAGVCGDSEISGNIVEVLCHEITSNEDVEVRRNSAVSLSRIPTRVLLARIEDIISALTAGMNDYATDERGDIGSWVREASMRSAGLIIDDIFGIKRITSFKGESSRVYEALRRMLESVVQQSCGRIDRTRAVAGGALTSFCDTFTGKVSHPALSPICLELSRRMKHVTNSDSDIEASNQVDFANTEVVFPAVCKFLEIKELEQSVFVGLVLAGGGMGHQSKAALDAVVRCFTEEGNVELKGARFRLFTKIIQGGNERISIPAFTVMQALAKRRALDGVNKADLIEAVKALRMSWRNKLRNVKRTSASVLLLGDLAGLSVDGFRFDFGEGTLGRECIEALAVVLGGTIPRLRRIAAECMYMTLIDFAWEEDEELDQFAVAAQKACPTVREAIDVLLDTSWEFVDTLKARKRRNLLCKLLRVRAPSVAARGQEPQAAIHASFGPAILTQ